MKKLLLTAGLLMICLNAFAADEINDLIKCQPLKLVPDLGMSVTLSQGGIAGLTTLKVERFFLGSTNTQNYIVRQQNVDPRLLGAPMTFTGDQVSFSVNYTTAPLKDGAHIGSLVTYDSKNNVVSNEQLSCKDVQSKVYALAQINGVDMNIASIELESTGALKVTSVKGKVKNLALSEKNQNTLLSEVKSLDSADLTTEKHVVICMMMISPLFRQDFTVFNSESNSLRVVLSSNSCATPEVIYPSDTSLKQMAQDLKSQLLTLGQQAKF